jgi:dTDP-4-amino-4,6-dideoxy-D-glucose acyltransferase
MSFLTQKQIEQFGFLSYGENILISEKASIYGASKISIGSNVRIDDFCILSAGERGIMLGSHIHIACYTSLIGKELISLGDFSNISSRVGVYSSSDDYSGAFMTNPTVPEEFTNVDHRSVSLERHCIIGSGSVILPGVCLGEGCAVGALSLVTQNCVPFGIYAGVPARLVRKRSQQLLECEKALCASKRILAPKTR